MLEAAMQKLSEISGDSAAAVRAEYGACRDGNRNRLQPITDYDDLRMRAIAVERQLLAEWRRAGHIQDDAYHLLEDELDRAELHAAPLASTSLDG